MEPESKVYLKSDLSEILDASGIEIFEKIARIFEKRTNKKIVLEIMNDYLDLQKSLASLKKNPGNLPEIQNVREMRELLNPVTISMKNNVKTVDHKNYKISIFPENSNQVDTYTSFEQQLGHVAFGTNKDLQQIIEKQITHIPIVNNLKNIARNSLRLVFKILEDHRVESVYGAIYYGSQKRFEQNLIQKGKYLAKIGDPVDALLAARYDRNDLLLNSRYEKIKSNYLEKIEKKEFERTETLSRLYYHEHLLPWIKDLERKFSSPSNEPQEKRQKNQKEKQQKESQNKNTQNNQDDSNDQLKDLEKKLQSDLHSDSGKDGNSTKGGSSIIYPPKGTMQTHDQENPVKLKPLQRNAIEHLNRKPTKNPRPNYRLSSMMLRMFMNLQDRQTDGLDYAGNEIDFEEYIQYKIKKEGEFFVDDRFLYGLDIIVAVDCSGSMEGEKINTSRDFCSTLFNSIRNLRNIELSIVGWSGPPNAEKVAVTDIDRSVQLKFLTIDRRHYTTPTHLAIQYCVNKLKRKKGKKLLIMITDGYPTIGSTKYSKKTLISLSQQAREDAIKKQIRTFGIYLEPTRPLDNSIQSIFQDDYFHCKDINDVSKKVLSIFTKQVVKSVISK